MGHPDWQSYPNWRGSAFVNQANLYPAGTTSLGPFAIQNYQSVLFTTSATPDLVSVLFNFYQDQALTQFVDAYTVQLAAGTAVKVIIPVPANFVQVQVVNSSGIGQTFTVSVTPVNIPVTAPQYYSNNNVVNQNNVSVPASSTLTAQLPYIQPGLTHFWYNPRDNSGKLTPSVVAGSNGNPGIAVFTSAGLLALDQRIIALTDKPYFVRVTNTDGAAAHSFDLALVPTGGLV